MLKELVSSQAFFALHGEHKGDMMVSDLTSEVETYLISFLCVFELQIVYSYTNCIFSSSNQWTV